MWPDSKSKYILSPAFIAARRAIFEKMTFAATAWLVESASACWRLPSWTASTVSRRIDTHSDADMSPKVACENSKIVTALCGRPFTASNAGVSRRRGAPDLDFVAGARGVVACCRTSDRPRRRVVPMGEVLMTACTSFPKSNSSFRTGSRSSQVAPLTARRPSRRSPHASRCTARCQLARRTSNTP